MSKVMWGYKGNLEGRNRINLFDTEIVSDIFGVDIENILTYAESKETATIQKLWGTEDVYLVSNENVGSDFGAIAFLFHSTRQKLRLIVGDRFFMLPSSVHEVLVMKYNEDADIDNLISMVREINRNKVKRSEWLSDTAYLVRLNGKYIELMDLETGEVQFI